MLFADVRPQRLCRAFLIGLVLLGVACILQDSGARIGYAYFLAGGVRAPAPLPRTQWRHARVLPPSMGMFDGFAAAFANDDTLGERQEAGLKQKKRTKTVTWRGPKPGNPFEQQKIQTSEVIAGQRLMDVARDLGVPVRYSCMNGSCGICNVKVDGNTVPMCITKAPDRDVTIDYVDKSGARAQKVPKGKVVPIPGKEGVPEKPRLTQASLEERLRAEMEAKKAAKKETGWFR